MRITLSEVQNRKGAESFYLLRFGIRKDTLWIFFISSHGLSVGQIKLLRYLEQKQNGAKNKKKDTAVLGKKAIMQVSSVSLIFMTFARKEMER